MSRQLTKQRDSSRRTLYVKGSWRCCLLFEITTPFGDITYPTHFSELELRICPAALLQATQSKIFEEASHGIAPTNSHLLHIFRRVAYDGTRSFRVCTRVLFLHTLPHHREHWLSPLEYRGLPALGQDYSRSRHGVDYRQH